MPDVTGSNVRSEIQVPFFECSLQKILPTARSLRSLETPRALSILSIVFSPERGENTMNPSLREKGRTLYQNSRLRNSDKIPFSAFSATLR